MNFELILKYAEFMWGILLVVVGVLAALVRDIRNANRRNENDIRKLEASLDKGRERFQRIEEKIGHLPDRADFKELEGKIDVMTESLKGQEKIQNGHTGSLRRIEDHLLNKKE